MIPFNDYKRLKYSILHREYIIFNFCYSVQIQDKSENLNCEKS